MPQNSILEHIELIARHEKDFLDKRSASERLGDAVAGFAGSLKFVCIHILIFAAWITANTLTYFRHFDPAPYSLLGTFITLEAILLASFILIRQARIGRRSDERAHLMLQVLLLTEKEITAMLDLSRQIAQEAGLHDAANQPHMEELSRDTSIDILAQTIRENVLPSE